MELVLWYGTGEGEGLEGEGEGEGEGEAEPGTEGGPCRDADPPDPCNDGLHCEQDRCVRIPEGEAGGPCYDNGLCNTHLTCEADLCTPIPPGELGGPCRPEGTCNPLLRCEQATCEPIPLGEAGGPCREPDFENRCDPGLVCEEQHCVAGECLPGAEQPCPDGTAEGECAPGSQRCGPERTWGECEGRVEPIAELCNGRDDDCDGETDEELTPPLAARQAGVCRDLEQLCDSPDGWVEPEYGLVPGYEDDERTCDEQDNDCDGEVDEGLGLGQACAVGIGACQRAGELACDDEGGVRCTATAGPPGDELCNGQDDDCDGETDEPAEVLGCAAGQVCFQADCCTPGTCEELGQTCGEQDDGCGGQIECGGCPGGFGCGPDGQCQWAGTVICGGETCPEHPNHWPVRCNPQDHCEYAPAGEDELPYQDEIWVPAGSFMMGSPAGEQDELMNEKPQHEVRLAKGYFIGKFEVTVERYETCINNGLCTPTIVPTWDAIGWGTNTSAKGRSRHPQNGLQWQQARDICGALGGRLPSEAEWEFAATGPVHRSFPWGDLPAPDCTVAVFDHVLGANGGLRPWGCQDCAEGGCSGTLPVGSRPAGASARGLLDMAGNVWEALEDCWHASYQDAPVDGSAWVESCTEAYPMIRGGSFAGSPTYLRSSLRYGMSLLSTNSAIGVRCVRDLPHCQNAATDCPAHPLGWTPECNAKGFCEYQPAGGTPAEEHQAEIYVPPGSFPMGSPADEAGRTASEGPVHRVTIAYGFFIGKYEVTVQRYEACQQASPNGCTEPTLPAYLVAELGWDVNRSPARSGHPQNALTWDQAGSFCKWSGERLPSEAEWEYAATGQKHELYPWAKDNGDLCAHAVHDDTGESIRLPWGCDPCSVLGCSGTSPVGSRVQTTRIGAHDLGGNIYEWADDCWHASLAGHPVDGSAWHTECAGDGVLRGGDAFNGPAMMRSSAREERSRTYRSPGIGVRCVRDLPGPDEDHDADGVRNETDNCPAIHNPDQRDLDNDQLGNDCDDDADGDGFDQLLDCNDLDAAIHPGAREQCNGIDDDCDGSLGPLTFSDNFEREDAEELGLGWNESGEYQNPAGRCGNGCDVQMMLRQGHVEFIHPEPSGYSCLCEYSLALTHPVLQGPSTMRLSFTYRPHANGRIVFWAGWTDLPDQVAISEDQPAHFYGVNLFRGSQEYNNSRILLILFDRLRMFESPFQFAPGELLTVTLEVHPGHGLRATIVQGPNTYTVEEEGAGWLTDLLFLYVHDGSGVSYEDMGLGSMNSQLDDIVYEACP